jgi:hypothetical protein
LSIAIFQSTFQTSSVIGPSGTISSIRYGASSSINGPQVFETGAGSPRSATNTKPNAMSRRTGFNPNSPRSMPGKLSRIGTPTSDPSWR